MARAAGPQDSVREDASGDLAASIPEAGAYQGSPGRNAGQVLPSESLIKTGSVSLQSDDIGHVLTQVYGIVGGVGGDISQEDTTTDDKGRAVRSTLVVRVPVDEFDSTLNDLSQLGTLVNRVRNSKDVTTEVADIDSRVRSAQRSINTLRQLFDRATRLSDIIRLESELAQREADLESLEAQQRSLDDKTTMSTITMTLELPPVAPKKPAPDDDDEGGRLRQRHRAGLGRTEVDDARGRSPGGGDPAARHRRPGGGCTGLLDRPAVHSASVDSSAGLGRGLNGQAVR